MTTTTNFEIQQGSTFSRTMTIVDTDKVPLNLTSYTLTGQLRKNYSSTDFVAFTIIVLNAATGKITINLDSEITSTLLFPKYVYDVEVSGNGNVYRILEGVIAISPNVTR